MLACSSPPAAAIAVFPLAARAQSSSALCSARICGGKYPTIPAVSAAGRAASTAASTRAAVAPQYTSHCSGSRTHLAVGRCSPSPLTALVCTNRRTSISWSCSPQTPGMASAFWKRDASAADANQWSICVATDASRYVAPSPVRTVRGLASSSTSACSVRSARVARRNLPAPAMYARSSALRSPPMSTFDSRAATSSNASHAGRSSSSHLPWRTGMYAPTAVKLTVSRMRANRPWTTLPSTSVRTSVSVAALVSHMKSTPPRPPVIAGVPAHAYPCELRK